MRQIYQYDTSNDNEWNGNRLVEDNYEPQPGETFIRPADGLHWPLKFDTALQRWYGPSDAEFAKLPSNLNTKPEPTTQQKLNSVVMSQLADLTVAKTTDTKINAGLMKDIAGLKIQLAQAKQQITVLNTTVKVLGNQPASQLTSLSTSQPASMSASESASASQPQSISTSESTSVSLSASTSTPLSMSQVAPLSTSLAPSQSVATNQPQEGSANV